MTRRLKLWVLLVLLIGIVLGSLLWIRVDSTYFALAREGVQTTGTVESLDVTTHRVKYTFIGDNGRIGYSEGVVGQGNPNFRDLRVGQEVLVFYRESNGLILCHLGNPSDDLKAHAIFLACVSLILSTTIILLMRFVSGSRRASST
jgi:hypothetical protein